jgi:GTP 3',8-cyclase
MNALTDRFGRFHNYLRISLTDACNMRCKYCMPLGNYHAGPSSKLMKPAEIETIAKVFVQLGVNKIRLTGGEPLVRKEFSEIASLLSQLPVSLAISTNGLLVDRFLDVLIRHNIHSVNISLDALDEQSFKAITRNGELSKIINNIQLLLRHQFQVKINMVVMKGVNENEMLQLAGLCKNFPIELRFIEFMPFDGNLWNREKLVSYAEMLEILNTAFVLKKLEDDPHDTTKKYAAEGCPGTIGFITTITSPFCEGCNRLRITSDGKMKNCLFAKSETDLLQSLRNGEDLIPLIAETVGQKKFSLGGQTEFEKFENRSMIQIGG